MPRSHLAAALFEPRHGFALLAAVALLVLGFAKHAPALTAAALLVEAAYLLYATLSPELRRRREQVWALELKNARRDRLQAAFVGLSPNAASRLRALVQLRETALAQLVPELRKRWATRLDELFESGLQLLVWLDANPPARASGELDRLRAEVAGASPGPAREAKAQRLALLESRAGRAGAREEQREAAVAQLDTVQDLLEDLAAAPLEGRDPKALGDRLVEVDALVGAARDSMSALRTR